MIKIVANPGSIKFQVDQALMGIGNEGFPLVHRCKELQKGQGMWTLLDKMSDIGF